MILGWSSLDAGPGMFVLGCPWDVLGRWTQDVGPKMSLGFFLLLPGFWGIHTCDPGLSCFFLGIFSGDSFWLFHLLEVYSEAKRSSIAWYVIPCTQSRLHDLHIGAARIPKTIS